VSTANIFNLLKELPTTAAREESTDVYAKPF